MHGIRTVSMLFGLIILFSPLEPQSFAQADEKPPRKGTNATSMPDRTSLFASSVRPLIAKILRILPWCRQSPRPV